MPGGDFENPEGNPPGLAVARPEGWRKERSEGPTGRRATREIFRIPDTEGIVGEDSRTKNPNLVHIFFQLRKRSPKT